MTTGYLPQDVILQLKMFTDKANIDGRHIALLLNSYQQSQIVRDANIADRYYLAQHDIRDKVRDYYVDGLREIDILAANNKAPNAFFAILVDQKVSKMVGKPLSVSVTGSGDREKPDADADKFQELLIKQLGVNFDDKIEQWIVGTSKHSVEWMHFYIDSKGDLKYLVCPAQQIIPVYDTQYEDKLVQIVRHYQYDFIDAKGDTKKLLKVELWTDKDVTYWTETEEGSFVLDYGYAVNPAPHWTVSNDTLGTKESHGWGRVPFVGLQNNSKGANDLCEVKALIDVYDRVYNGWADDVEDFAEQVLVIKNLVVSDRELNKGMTELAVMLKNLKQHRAIGVSGDGSVTNLRTEIPVEAKEKLLQLTREAIFYFGQGVDVSSEKFGNSPSGVALQHLYALLEMKCNRATLKLKKSFEEFFWFVTEYINQANNTAFDSYDIIVTVNQSMIFNKKETIDGIIARDYLSRKTKIMLDPDVEDVDEEMDRLDAEEQGKAKNPETDEKV